MTLSLSSVSECNETIELEPELREYLLKHIKKNRRGEDLAKLAIKNGLFQKDEINMSELVNDRYEIENLGHRYYYENDMLPKIKEISQTMKYSDIYDTFSSVLHNTLQKDIYNDRDDIYEVSTYFWALSRSTEHIDTIDLSKEKEISLLQSLYKINNDTLVDANEILSTLKKVDAREYQTENKVLNILNFYKQKSNKHQKDNNLQEVIQELETSINKTNTSKTNSEGKKLINISYELIDKLLELKGKLIKEIYESIESKHKGKKISPVDMLVPLFSSAIDLYDGQIWWWICYELFLQQIDKNNDLHQSYLRDTLLAQPWNLKIFSYKWIPFTDFSKFNQTEKRKLKELFFQASRNNWGYYSSELMDYIPFNPEDKQIIESWESSDTNSHTSSWNTTQTGTIIRIKSGLYTKEECRELFKFTLSREKGCLTKNLTQICETGIFETQEIRDILEEYTKKLNPDSENPIWTHLYMFGWPSLDNLDCVLAQIIPFIDIKNDSEYRKYFFEKYNDYLDDYMVLESIIQVFWHEKVPTDISHYFRQNIRELFHIITK